MTLLHLLFVGAAWATPLLPDEAVALALAGHPDVARAEADLAGTQGEARQTAFLLSNPTFEAGVAVVGDRRDASIGQDLSVTGEGLNAHRAAVARREAAEHALARARLLAAAEVRHAWVAAVVARDRAALAEQAFELATRMLAATEAKVRVGEASELDLRLARMEQARAARDLLEAGAGQVDAITTLSALVRRPLDAVDVEGGPLLAAPSPSGSTDGDRSDLLAARSSADAAKAGLARARSAALPAVTLGAFAEDDAGDVVMGPSLGLTLPLWHQNQAETSAASGELAAATVDVAALEARVAAERAASQSFQSTADTVMGALGPDLQADAAQALQSIERGFAAGELDLPDTVFLRAEVVEGRIAFVEAQGAQADARIEALLAHDDPALLAGAP